MDNNSSIYLGTECEGSWVDRGKQTIFIPKGVTNFLGVSPVYNKIRELGCTRIYFGAKGRRGLDKEDIKLIEWLKKDEKGVLKYQILVEVTDFSWIADISRDLAQKIEFVFVTTTKEKETIKISHFKIETPVFVDWYVLQTAWTTPMDDREYTKDKEIKVQ